MISGRPCFSCTEPSPHSIRVGDHRSRYLGVGGANVLDAVPTIVRASASSFSRILRPTATLVQDSGTSAERAPPFDKAFFRKATCTPVGSHFQKLRHAQVLFFCTGAVFLYCFSRSCEIFTDSCNERNIDLSRLAYTKNTCML